MKNFEIIENLKVKANKNPAIIDTNVSAFDITGKEEKVNDFNRQI